MLGGTSLALLLLSLSVNQPVAQAWLRPAGYVQIVAHMPPWSPAPAYDVSLTCWAKTTTGTALPRERALNLVSTWKCP